LKLVDFLARVLYIAWVGERRRGLKKQLKTVFKGLTVFDSAAGEAPVSEAPKTENFKPNFSDSLVLKMNAVISSL
jgi:hypothetical protein